MTRSTTERPSATDILNAVGEAVYDWDIATDAIRWGANASRVLGLLGFEAIGSGAAYESALDGDTTRATVVHRSANTDTGNGVPYSLRYGFRRHPGAAPVQVEDTGRWYADERGRPVHAMGVVRVIDPARLREETGRDRWRLDALTGGLTRVDLVAELDRAIAALAGSRRSAAFLMIAIDGLRELNDAYGVTVGDEAIGEAARRIAARMRSGDVMGRHSGNTIGVLAMNCSDKSAAIAGARFAAAVREDLLPTSAGGLAVTASVGGVVVPRQAATAVDAVLGAERALQRARREARGGFVQFDAVRDGAPTGRPETAALVAAALGDQRVSLGFADLVAVADGAAVGRRAVARFARTPGETIGDLVPATPPPGLGLAVDKRLVELALDELGRQPEGDLTLAVSDAALTDPRWGEMLTRAVGAKPEAARFVVEVRAASVAEHPAGAARLSEQLARLDVGLAVGGFGAGTIPIDALRPLALKRIHLAATLADGDATAAAVLVPIVALARALAEEVAAPVVADGAELQRFTLAGVRIVADPDGKAGPLSVAG